MDVLVKFYSSNYETYKSHYKQAAKLALAMDNIFIEDDKIRYELIYILGDTIQKQRHSSTEHSRTMRVYVNKRIRYVIGVTNTNYDEDKRIEAERTGGKYVYGTNGCHSNTYLLQGINKIFSTFLEERKNNPSVILYFYLLDTDKSYSCSLSNLLTYRKLATVGFNVLNIGEIKSHNWSDLKIDYKQGMNIAYTSFNKFLNDTAFVSSLNRGNIPAYIKCIEEEVETLNGNIEPSVTKYIYTFKGLGAEAYDCFLTMWTLIVLAEKEGKTLEFLFAPEKYNFRLGQKHPAFTQDIPKTIKRLFEQLGVQVKYETTEEVLQQLEREKNKYEKAKQNNQLRNQELFKNNLRAKGVQTKCYLCGCEVETILEAAHFWGVADIRKTPARTINLVLKEDAFSDIIDKDSKYAKELFYKKYMLANSGHNGVWLCSNHHGLYDGHHFIFNSEDGKIIITTDDLAKQFIEESMNCEGLKKLEKQVLSPETKIFIKYANKK